MTTPIPPTNDPKIDQRLIGTEKDVRVVRPPLLRLPLRRRRRK